MTTAMSTGHVPLTVESEWVDDVRVVRFRGAKILNDDNAREMGLGLDAEIDQSGPLFRVVIDLAGVKMISSATLAKLILFKRRLKERGGEMALCRLCPPVMRTFQVTNLAEFFAIHPDLETAQTSFE